MGKYMRRKSKTTSEVSLMDMPSLGGVLTRAKTLALQKSTSVSVAGAATGSGSGSYIQLRSRRLVKPNSPKRQKERCLSPKTNKASYKGANCSRVKVDSENSCGDVEKLVDKGEIRGETGVKDGVDFGTDEEKGSFGENTLEIEGKERGNRETTPCSLIRDPDAIRTPGSSTKPPCSADAGYRIQFPTPRHIPSATEMDEFFTEPEKQQQREFIEKYNFDPVNDKPLPGRYEWVKVDDTKNC